MKYLILTSAIGLSGLINAQQGFFQTMEANGADAVYHEYYHVDDYDKDGIYELSGSHYDYTLKLRTMESGEKIGFEAETPESKYSGIDADAIIWYDSLLGFPHTYMILDENGRDGIVFIEDYIFDLKGVNLTDFTFKEIDRVLIRRGSASKEETTEESTEEKGKLKGKLGGLKNKLKDALVDQDAKKLMEKNLNDYITSYLIEMRKKDESYTMTASEAAEFKKIQLARVEYQIEVSEGNAAYWASPAGQETLRRMRESQGVREQEDACSYTLTNSTGQSIYIIVEGEKNQRSVYQKESFNCKKKVYYSNNQGDRFGFIAGGSQSYGGQSIEIGD